MTSSMALPFDMQEPILKHGYQCRKLVDVGYKFVWEPSETWWLLGPEERRESSRNGFLNGRTSKGSQR